MAYKPPRDIEPVFPRPLPDAEVRERLFELLGTDDRTENTSYTIENDKSEGEMKIQHVRFPNRLGETVTGVLVDPTAESDADRPAVVCTPGTSHDADLLVEERFRRDESGALRGWARELARRGFVTLSLTLHLNMARQGTNEEYHQQKTKLLAPYGISPMGLLVDEVLRGAELLASRDTVDSGRIGLTGFSLGGNATWYAFACAPWLRAAAPICGGVGSLRRQIHDGDPERHGPYFYLPHMLRYFDHPTIIRTCIAPRPFFMVAPTEDEDMPPSGVDAVVREVEPAYAQAEAATNFSVYRPEGRHEFREEYFERMVTWFRTHLHYE